MWSRAPSTSRRQRGFTLIELMIVVAVLAILARIAFSSYQNSIVKSRRSAAEACLLEEAQYMERYFTTNLTYVNADSTANWPTLQCATAISAHYTLAKPTIDSAKPREYTLTAAPVSGSQQANRDTKCATLKIDQRGTKSVTGTGSVTDCW